MLKRLLILAAGLVLFVTAFFVHEWWYDASLEGRFSAERQKFGVEGQDLVTANPPASEPLTPTPPPLPVVATPGASVPAAPIPSAVPEGVPTPADSPLNSNTLIGPMPPTAAPTDSNAPGTPAAPSTNGAPASTLIYPALRQLPLVLMSSFAPRVQETAGAPAAPAPSAPSVAAEPSTNNQTAAPAPAAPRAEAAAEEPAATKAVSVIVLGYHQFTPPGVRAGGKFIYTMPQDVFESEMKYLKDNNYNVVPLSDVVAFAKKEKTLPPNTVAITIDDGYKSSIVYAAPILKKYGFPWTFFIYPAFITRHESKGAASWPDLVELEKEGIDVECHSMTHPILKSTFQHWPRGDKTAHHLTPEEYDAFLTDECLTSKQIIEKELNKTVKYIAYPYGEYNKQVEAKAISAGYEAIFTVANNPIHPGTPAYSMGRYVITTPVEKMFVSYLHEGALGLADISPAPGSTVSDPRPTISATLGYEGTINPASIVAEVSEMGEVKCDFDPKSSTLRLFLPRDLVAPNVKVNVYAKDAATGKTMVASWRFNYEPTETSMVHPAIGAAPATNAVAATNAPAIAAEPAPATNTLAQPAPVTTTNATAAAAPASNAVPAEPVHTTP